jgi:hypothetical protein
MDRLQQPVAYFDSLSSYLESAFDNVEGWLPRMSAIIIAHLSVSQVRSGLRGDVCEIGVHHGKLFCLLANSTLSDEVAHAVDVFGDQHKNVDNSGFGDRDIFERNVAKYAPLATLDIIQESSLDLGRTSLMNSRLRMVSIDGGHTSEIVLNDIRIIEQCLVKGGIVVLDDVLNPHWLGVITGIADYYHLGGKLVPFAGSPNKIYLTSDEESARAYKHNLSLAFPLANEKKSNVEFFGGQIDYYGSTEYYEQTKRVIAERKRTDLAQRISQLEQQNEKLLIDLNVEKKETEKLMLDLRMEKNEAERLQSSLKLAVEQDTKLLHDLNAEKNESERLRNSLQLAERRYAEVLLSSSWRVTGPLRRIKSWFL